MAVGGGLHHILAGIINGLMHVPQKGDIDLGGGEDNVREYKKG
jgi:hypothetical protein